MPASIPTRTQGSLGISKSNAISFANQPTRLAAEEYNTAADVLIEIAEEIGETASPDSGSILFRLDALEAQLADLTELLALADLVTISGSVGEEIVTFASSIQIGHKLILDIASPAQLTGNADDYAIPTGSNARSVLRLSSSTGVNITGIVAAETGYILKIANVGSNSISLIHQSVASAAENRIIGPNGGNLNVGAGEGCTLVYDGTTLRWRIIGYAV